MAVIGAAKRSALPRRALRASSSRWRRDRRGGVLGNVAQVDCTGDAQCAAAFGSGSCYGYGFCTEVSVESAAREDGADGRGCFGLNAQGCHARFVNA
jgi:hypothetical protein